MWVLVVGAIRAAGLLDYQHLFGLLAFHLANVDFDCGQLLVESGTGLTVVLASS